MRQMSWQRRFFWRSVFDTDNIDIGPERRQYLDHQLRCVCMCVRWAGGGWGGAVGGWAGGLVEGPQGELRPFMSRALCTASCLELSAPHHDSSSLHRIARTAPNPTATAPPAAPAPAACSRVWEFNDEGSIPYVPWLRAPYYVWVGRVPKLETLLVENKVEAPAFFPPSFLYTQSWEDPRTDEPHLQVGRSVWWWRAEGVVGGWGM